MSPSLTFLAGEKALETIREKGLDPGMIRVIAGAAGGPKWIVLSGLDRYIFSQWLTSSEKPVHLLGSSIGAYRFGAAMRRDPEAAIERLLDAYIHQAYQGKPSAKEVTDKGAEIIQDYLDDDGVSEVLSHPFFRLNVLSVRCKGPTASENKTIMVPGLVAAALANVVSRNHLRFFFTRTLFYDPRDIPPFYTMNHLPTDRVPLSPENLRLSILASGSIPMVMSGVSDIPGTAGGMFRDGGMVDYHMDIPYGIPEGIVLFPHYTDRIVPGWLDKKLSWRKPCREHVKNLLLVCPSRDFISKLPCAKIPDRDDFKTFFGKDKDRFAYWKAVAERSRELSDEFSDAVLSGKIRQLVRPLA